MKKALFLILTITTLVSCKKESEPDPDYTEGLTGTYAVSYLKSGADVLNLPTNLMTAGIRVTKKDTKKITMVLTIINSGQQSAVDFGTIELKSWTTNSCELWANNDKVGTISKTSISINWLNDNGQILQIQAAR